MTKRSTIAVVCLLVAVGTATGQTTTGQTTTVSQRGFVETTGTLYPRTTPTDDTRWVGEAMLRQEASWRPAPWLALTGAFDARAATDGRVDYSWTVDWKDRGQNRPALGVRSLSVAFNRRGFTLEAGKLFVRWGKADILNPTDRFAPRDFLEVVDNDFLGVTGVRATYERGADTLDLVWVPLFTPSRMPIPGSRWASGSTVNLPAANTVPIVDLGPIFPSRAQAGFRWNHVGAGVEYSLSYFDGFNNLPRIDYSANPALFRAEVRRIYAPMRMAGADVAWPLRWFTLKGETGYFWTTDSRADDYGIYVIQVERQQGEWLFVAGYAGEYVTRNRTVATVPVYDFDRGLANTFLGRVSYTIDPLSSVAFEGAVRHDASGGWFKAEYSRAAGQHWRATARADLLAGSPDDLFGRYRRNSSLRLTLRYSY
jgi:hypothetical protein